MALRVFAACGYCGDPYAGLVKRVSKKNDIWICYKCLNKIESIYVQD